MVNEYIKDDETLDDLQLKGIQLIQKKDSFRFGVDAVLLANFAKIKRRFKVIDLCSGTGIIPFIIAGKTDAEKITGIEIQENMVEMAKRTVELNNLEERVDFINLDLKDVKYLSNLEKADVVTVNPPYKLKNSGLISMNDKNAIARHEICCTIEDVIVAAKAVLKHNGRIYIIHRPDRLVDIFCSMRKHKIEPRQIRMIHPNYTKAPTMLLIEGQNNGGKFLKWLPPLYIYDPDGNYTLEINEIYGK
jgi:tRNA1Val (adenine37-N6)-methyltransferase